MSQDRIQQLIDYMRNNLHKAREWSPTELINALEQMGMGSREADRIITQALTLGLLDSRPIGRTGKRKRLFLPEESREEVKEIPKQKKVRKKKRGSI